MGSKATAIFFSCMLCMLITLPPAYSCQQGCGPPSHRPTPHPRPPSKPHPRPHPPKHRPPQTPCPSPPHGAPPIVNPPVILPPPVISPPITNPPGIIPPIINPPAAKCSIDALKLGLCLDVLGGLVHVGIGNPVENICCPVIQGLIELEAAVCLCTTIRLKLLNLNIFIPLALQVLATCGLSPPQGFTCPPLK
ncbi:hypothetical protein ACS0TY_030293 [Phlomoides rotata]